MIDENIQVDENVQVEPDAISKTRSAIAKSANLKHATANHFGVPVEEVDDQMIEMYESGLGAQ
jgi:hypothetical protein